MMEPGMRHKGHFRVSVTGSTSQKQVQKKIDAELSGTSPRERDEK